MMDRKQFLVSSTLAAFSLSAFGNIIEDENENFTGDCLTTDDILGPFYRKNAPLTQDLNFEGLVGNKIKIQGSVYKDDCTTKLKDALVEIWHCDTEGTYDNDSDLFRHRAGWKSDKEGKYEFNTIMPGKYLNGKLFRPAHIHFRITCAGYKEIVSQIYFSGDPHITEDPWASQGKAKERILSINPVDTKGGFTVNFDIFMAKK